MPRVTYVKKAQQRYAMVPVLDENGQPKRTPVLRKDGTPKKTKTGREVFMKVTVADKTKPLPNRKCGKCDAEIKVGDPYKHISPKSGPYGGRTLYRCAACPTWMVWEYSSSMGARIEQMIYNCGQELDSAEDEDAVESALNGLAEEINGLAEEKRDAANNIESGFGHPTFASEELEQIADSLEGWASDIESIDVPALSDYTCDTCSGEQEVECDECDGSGEIEAEAGEDLTNCPECDGQCKVECPECRDWENGTDMDAWRSAVEDAVSAYQESPV